MTRRPRPGIGEDPESLGTAGHPVGGSAQRGGLLGRRAVEGSDEDSS